MPERCHAEEIKEMSDASVLTRPICNRVNLSKRFSVFNEKYERQYAHIYYYRGTKMRSRVEDAARKKWGNDINICSLSDLKIGEKCCIIGTIFKIMSLQPSILKELSDEHHVQNQPERSRFTSEDDRLILEDTVQRISLAGNVSIDEFYTGSIVGFYGTESVAGKFFVDEFTYAGLPPQVPLPSNVDDETYVLFVSGFGIGGKREKTLEIQLLIDYVTGMLGENDDQMLCSRIVHVIIAGNSLAKNAGDKDLQTKARYLTYKSEAGTVQGISDLDYFLSQLVPNVSVDLMSGEFDPTNHILPQKPMHPCMFPTTRLYHANTFFTVSNPYESKINDVHFLGTSGQNLNNMRMYSGVDDGLKLLSDTIEGQHIAPTAPDTLGCFPFYDSDPFIIEECPHVYFAGNQPKFSSQIKHGEDGQKVLLLCIPEFNKTNSAVLFNLKTLGAEELNFCADFGISEEMETEHSSPEK